MSDNTDDSAAELAERAATQAKHATRNGARAVKAVGEDVVERVVDEAQDTVAKFEGTLEELNDAIESMTSQSNRIVAKHLGVGTLAFGVSVVAASFAIKQFLYARGYRNGTTTAITDVVEAHSQVNS